MKKEEIAAAAQILEAMKEVVEKLEKAQKKGLMERVARAKKELMGLQAELDKIL